MKKIYERLFTEGFKIEDVRKVMDRYLEKEAAKSSMAKTAQNIVGIHSFGANVTQNHDLLQSQSTSTDYAFRHQSEIKSTKPSKHQTQQVYHRSSSTLSKTSGGKTTKSRLQNIYGGGHIQSTKNIDNKKFTLVHKEVRKSRDRSVRKSQERISINNYPGIVEKSTISQNSRGSHRQAASKRSNSGLKREKSKEWRP